MLATDSNAAPGNTKMSVVLIAPDNERRKAIATVIAGTQSRIAREFADYPLSTTVESDCDAVIVDLGADVQPGLALIEAICSRDVAVTVMACAAGNDADVVIRAMRAGAREFLPTPLSASTIGEAFTRAYARRQSALPERVPGRLLVFQGAKGGTGVTTLAINFACALAKRNGGADGRKTVLVDLHPQLGESALGLGLVPQFSIGDALANAVRLDADFLSTLLTKHESGLNVLASSDVYGTHRSLERGAEKLFRILREEFAFVVVDAGSCSGNIPDTLFSMADSIYLVTEVNLPSLRNARRLITYFGNREGPPQLEVVLNRFNSRMVEIDEESTTKALSRPVDWKIPNDYMAVRGAQNLGVPLVQQDTSISRAIYQMADAASGKSASVQQKKAAGTAKGDKWKFWTSNNIRPLSTARS